MKTLYLFIALLLFHLSVFSQAGTKYGMSNYEVLVRAQDTRETVNEFGLTRAEFRAIENEMYVNHEFTYGNIYENGKEVVTRLPMRYNAYTDQIEVKTDHMDQTYQTLAKDKRISVKTLREHYVYLPFNGQRETSGFMDVLVDGSKYRLYKKTVSTFQPQIYPMTSYDSKTPASFNQRIYYYLAEPTHMEEIPNGNRKRTKLLQNENKKMKAWIKANNLKLKDEDDLKKAVEYLNTIT